MRSCNRFSRVPAFVSAATAASQATSPAFSAERPEDSDFFILVPRLSTILISIPQRFTKARREKLCFDGYVRVTQLLPPIRCRSTLEGPRPRPVPPLFQHLSLIHLSAIQRRQLIEARRPPLQPP